MDIVEFKVIDEALGGVDETNPRPQKLKLEHGSAGRFGKAEIESVAGKILAFFQEKGYWCGFTLSELIDFCRENEIDPPNNLIGLCGYWYNDSASLEMMGKSWTRSYPYLVNGPGLDGKMFVTNHFLEALKKRE